MQAFSYTKLKNEKDALGSFGKGVAPHEVKFLAGGTTLLDLMKLEVERPRVVVDINGLDLQGIAEDKDRVRIGAMVKNSVLAHHPLIQSRYPVLSEAILAGASPQLRNKATTSGNLLQRTRCVYFRDTSKPCNKRDPKSGCAALEGFNRNLAILGTSEQCIATNPSDMNVAMMALEAVVHIKTAKGDKDVPIADFYLLPGQTPEKETVLAPGELITAVSLAPFPANTKSLYVKLRDRASYEFALASTAAILTVNGGRIERARIAMGGIGTKPWRSIEVEKLLEGKAPSEALFKSAAEELVRGAKTYSENGFKVELAKRCLIHSLKQAAKA